MKKILLTILLICSFNTNAQNKISYTTTKNEKTLNFKFHNTHLASNPSTINTVVYYVIFERDNWPTPKKSHTFTFVDGSQRTVEYRSWQSKYHAESVLATGYNNNYEYLNGYTQDNDEIKYNLRNN